MKICLTTMMDDDFFCAFEAFWKSFIYNNSWFDYPFVIIDLDLKEATKKKIKKYYDNVIFIKPNYERYKNVKFERTHQRLKATYYKLDVFSLDFDRVVFLDLDMLVLGDIKELFETDAGIVGVKTYREANDGLGNDINTGVFVVNKEYLNEKTYSAIVKFAECGFSMPDQKAINGFFNGKISYANKSYNCEKRIIHSKKIKQFTDVKNIKILHFVGSKPWEENKTQYESRYEELEEIWWSWYGKNREDFNS